MLRYGLTHPEILAALAVSGHGSRVLIADGHYPVKTGAAATATRVSLNLAPGIPTVTQVLEVLVDAIAIEAPTVMQPPASEPSPPIFAEFERLVPGHSLERLNRHAFYEAARGQDLALVIATGERRTYANILLTVGVV